MSLIYYINLKLKKNKEDDIMNLILESRIITSLKTMYGHYSRSWRLIPFIQV